MERDDATTGAIADSRTRRDGEATLHGTRRDSVAVLAPPTSASTSSPSICVIIPARDEARTISSTLHAFATQVELDGSPFPRARYEILVLANNCRDNTAAVSRAAARAFLPSVRVHVLEWDFAHGAATVVHARRALMDEACGRLLVRGHGRGIIASTDADTAVSPTWLAATAAEIEAGADAVGGRILASRETNAWVEPRTRRYHLLDVAYRHLVAEVESLLDPDASDPWPRHHQYFGASLAVTAEMYRRVGGLPFVPVLEDVALHDALRRCDARIRHSPGVRVTTSARRGGRVAMGLSTQLGEWDALARERVLPLVESAAMVERRTRLRRALRELWHGARRGGDANGQPVAALAREIGLAHRGLVQAALVPRPFGLFYEAVQVLAPDARDGESTAGALTPIDAAVAALRSRLAVLRREPPVAPLPARCLPPLEDVEPVVLFPTTEAVG